jgi:hypothetical protein
MKLPRSAFRFDLVAPVIVLGALGLAAAPRSSADEGMWLFNKPPAKALAEKYGFQVADEWLLHLQRSCVRFPGGSGSFVSPYGLVMTNHHVGADWLHKLSTPERNIVQDGYLARTQADELPCPDLDLRVLWLIEDVTAVLEQATDGLPAAEAGAARRKAMTALESEKKAATGLECEVVTLYQGGRYHLYGYKRFDDVRLVMAPEMQVAFYGGDADNFEFPRGCLDMTFFRVYERGKPLSSEHYLEWSPDGAKDGDLVFVAGHPGSTQRLYTLAHLTYMRDTQLPQRLAALWRREVQLQTFSGRSREQARIARDDLFGVQNSRKALTGQLEGLLDPAVWSAKVKAEEALRAAVESRPEWKAQWGDAWDKVASAQVTAKSLLPRMNGLGGASLRTGSELATIAVHIVRLADETPKPNTERLREYTDAGREALLQGLYSPAPIHLDLEVERLQSFFLRMAEHLGADDPLVQKALAGRSPAARASELVRKSKLVDVGVRKALVEGGAAAVNAAGEPLFELVRALDADSRALRKRYEDEVQSVERAAYAQIAAAKFAVEGEGVYPDATFTLRLAYGTVAGYEQDGQRIEPFTDFDFLYRRAEERAGEEAFALPQRWAEKRPALDGKVPYNFVHTCDIIGGNSGSPTVDRAGRVVGLIFDGNIQSLVAGVTYTDAQARAVSVDSRGMLEALRAVYGATELVNELTGKPSAQSDPPRESAAGQ